MVFANPVAKAEDVTSNKSLIAKAVPGGGKMVFRASAVVRDGLLHAVTS
jgi:hypothetical protein